MRYRTHLVQITGTAKTYHKASRRATVKASEQELLVDQDFMDELNKVRKRTRWQLSSKTHSCCRLLIYGSHLSFTFPLKSWRS